MPVLPNMMAATSSNSMDAINISQTRNTDSSAMNFMSQFNMMNPLTSGGTDPTPQQQKDFRVLEQNVIDICQNQCLKRERTFHKESEMCQAKCYDTAMVYHRVGLNEIN